MITDRDIAWAAGFLEGEGTFLSSGATGAFTVSACQVQYEPLGRLLAIFGGRVKPYTNNHGRVYHRWSLHGGEAIGMAFTMFSLLSRKRRDQVQLMVGRWKARPGRTNKFKTHCPRGHEYTADNIYRYGTGKGQRARSCRTCVRTVYLANRRLVRKGA